MYYIAIMTDDGNLDFEGPFDEPSEVMDEAITLSGVYFVVTRHMDNTLSAELLEDFEEFNAE